jgi:hypothetical protein
MIGILAKQKTGKGKNAATAAEINSASSITSMTSTNNRHSMVILSNQTFKPRQKTTHSMRIVDDSSDFAGIGFQPSRNFSRPPVEGDVATWEGKGSIRYG